MDTFNPAEKTARIQRGRPFERGTSGNPKGRPKGARNHATVLAEALFEGEAEAIIRKAIDTALNGDSTAIRLCIDRILPPRRGRPVSFKLPATLRTSAEAVEASASVLTACAAGELEPNEASQILGLIASHIRLVEMTEIEERMITLESTVQKMLDKKQST